MRSVVHMIGKGRGQAYRTIADSVGCPVEKIYPDVQARWDARPAS